MVSTSSISAHLVSASRKWPAMDSETAWKASATGRVVNAPAARAIFSQRSDRSKVAWSSHRLPAAAVPSAERRYGGLVAEGKPGAVSLEQEVADRCGSFGDTREDPRGGRDFPGLRRA